MVKQSSELWYTPDPVRTLFVACCSVLAQKCTKSSCYHSPTFFPSFFFFFFTSYTFAEFNLRFCFQIHWLFLFLSFFLLVVWVGGGDFCLLWLVLILFNLFWCSCSFKSDIFWLMLFYIIMLTLEIQQILWAELPFLLHCSLLWPQQLLWACACNVFVLSTTLSTSLCWNPFMKNPQVISKRYWDLFCFFHCCVFPLYMKWCPKELLNLWLLPGVNKTLTGLCFLLDTCVSCHL